MNRIKSRGTRQEAHQLNCSCEELPRGRRRNQSGLEIRTEVVRWQVDKDCISDLTALNTSQRFHNNSITTFSRYGLWMSWFVIIFNALRSSSLVNYCCSFYAAIFMLIYVMVSFTVIYWWLLIFICCLAIFWLKSFQVCIVIWIWCRHSC